MQELCRSFLRFASNGEDFRSPTHKFHSDSGIGELDEGKVVFGMLFVSSCDGAIVFDFAGEPLDCVAQFIEPGAEGRFANPLRHEPDIGPNAAFCHLAVQGIGVISAVGEQDIAWSQTVV